MNLKNVLIFTLGVAAGSLVTWKLVEKKYKDLADEEIESVKEYYNNKLMEDEELQGLTSDECEDIGKAICEGIKEGINEVEEYKNKVEDLYYIEDDTEGIFITVNADIIERVQPYVISPDEYGEYGNKMRCLTFYADSVLADEEDDMIVDPEYFIGDGLAHFGEYEDDSVHVRNENLETDFEILKSEKTFSEINKEDD